MSSHGIGQYNFEHWQGPPPGLPQEHVISHNRAGADGVAMQLMGKWGDRFEVLLTSHWASGILASAASAAMMSMCGAGWYPVKYATLNYTGLYGVGYHVIQIEHVDIHVAGILIGPGYAYSNGGVLVSRYTLHPEKL